MTSLKEIFEHPENYQNQYNYRKTATRDDMSKMMIGLFLINVLFIAVPSYYLYSQNGINIIENGITTEKIDWLLVDISFLIFILALSFLGLWIAIKRYKKMMPMMVDSGLLNPLFFISTVINILFAAASGYIFYYVVNSQVYGWDEIKYYLGNPVFKMVYFMVLFFPIAINVMLTLGQIIAKVIAGRIQKNPEMSNEELSASLLKDISPFIMTISGKKNHIKYSKHREKKN